MAWSSESPFTGSTMRSAADDVAVGVCANAGAAR
jgi:hypothetical protein